MDPVTFRVSGRKKLALSVKTVTFRPFSRRDMSISVHLKKNLLSFGDYFQYSCAISMNENFQGNF